MRRQTEQFQCPTQESIPSFRFGGNATCRVRISAATRAILSSSPSCFFSTSIRPLPLPSKSFPIHHPPINLPSTIFFGNMTTSSTEKRLFGLTPTRWCLSCQSYKRMTKQQQQQHFIRWAWQNSGHPGTQCRIFCTWPFATWWAVTDIEDQISRLLALIFFISYYAAWSHMGSFNIKAASLCCTKLSLQHTATLAVPHLGLFTSWLQVHL